MKNDKESSLTKIETENEMYEYIVGETYEYMNWSNIMQASVLFLICVFILGLCILISPNSEFISKKIIETDSKTKQINVAVRYKNLKFYHKKISFAIQSSRPKGKYPMTVLISGTVKFRKDGYSVAQYLMEERSFKLPAQELVTLFNSGSSSITDIYVDLDLSCQEGQLNEIYLVWYHQNYSWNFFVILLKSVSFLVTFYIFVELLIRISSLKGVSSTYIERIYLILSFVFSFLRIPLTEIQYFVNFKFLDQLLPLLDSLNFTLEFYLFTISCWSLKIKNQENEIPVFKITTFIFVIIFFVITFPKAIKLNENYFSNIAERWIPIVMMSASMINIFRFPFSLNVSTPEFQSSFIHLFLCVPSMAIMIYISAFHCVNESKVSVFSSILNSLSFLFLTLLHWPRGDSYDKTYLIAGKDDFVVDIYSDSENNKKQKDIGNSLLYEEEEIGENDS